MSFRDQQSHQARDLAESFGVDPERYDRTRPRYPEALVQRIVAASPGRDVVDVGCGTGISSRQFRDAGCTVLGVEVDGRMAAFARSTGLEVEVARFEEWDPAGRAFAAVVAGQTWHWVDPVLGAARAAQALRPAGRLAVFWNVQQPPPALGEAFGAVYRHVLPDSPFAAGAGDPRRGYAAFVERTADGIWSAGGFGEPEQWSWDWEQAYTRDEWLDQVPTSGGHSRFPPATLDALLDGIGSAIDAVGGAFTVSGSTVAVTAERLAAPDAT